MYGGRRKCRHAYRNIFRCFIRRGVLDPLPGMCNHSLSSLHIERSTLVRHPESSTQYDGVLLKFRRLSRLLPSRRTPHVGHAHIGIFRVDPAYIFINQFRFVSSGLNACRALNESWQIYPPLLNHRRFRSPYFCVVAYCAQSVIYLLSPASYLIRHGDAMRTASFLAFIVLLATVSFAQGPIHEQLSIDATDAPRNIIHSVVTIPVAPGPTMLVYPKWIPGNHRPTGPIQNLTGIHVKAAGQEIPWQRDLEDMYAFHLQVPAGVKELQVAFDTITYYEKRSLSSTKVLDLVWNQEVIYPQGIGIDDVQITASVRLPEGWKFGTALDVAHQSGNTVEFAPVTLNRLVDSPLIAGLYYRQVQLTPPGEKPVHVIDMVAESPDELEITDKDLASYKQLVAETGKLFGARHYEKYHFLLTLSDETAHHGLEHHEYSDNGAAEDMFENPNSHNLEADLLPHEFTHSWNGKYRRPKGLVHLT